MNPMSATRKERPLNPVNGDLGALGLYWLLASLALLFLTTLISIWAVRGNAELWHEGQPGLPMAVWLSTLVLVLLSWLSQRSVKQLRADRPTESRKNLLRAFPLALTFLGLQCWNWYQMYARGMAPDSGMYAFSFFVLTWLHAAHVIGGVVFHWKTLRRAADFSAQNPGWVRHNALYWHFLGLTWVFILLTLYGTASKAGTIWAGNLFFGLFWAGVVGGVICWLLTVRLLWRKDGPGWGLLGLFPLFSVVFGWVRFQEHDNLRVMITWQVCIFSGMIGYIMMSFLR
jgi:heme/copper-type cytochrome/quinol oxidase subunit 3